MQSVGLGIACLCVQYWRIQVVLHYVIKYLCCYSAYYEYCFNYGFSAQKHLYSSTYAACIQDCVFPKYTRM